MAKERAFVSFLIAKHEMDPSNQIEKEKNTRENPRQITRFSSPNESVHPTKTPHWVLQEIFLIRALYSLYFRIEKDTLIRTKVLTCCIHLSFKISGLEITKLQLELQPHAGGNPEYTHGHTQSTPKQDKRADEKSLPIEGHGRPKENKNTDD
jgi:hypothetical protein